MADYDWGLNDCQTRGCPAHKSSPWRSHSAECRVYKTGAFHSKMNNRGFTWNDDAKAWHCERGCGCLVWDPEAHQDNVCTIRL